MLSNIKAKIKKVLPFQTKTNYKTLYENEKRLRKELEDNHATFCKQISATIKESKQRFSIYKATNSDKEF